jgi:hypothetical protein
VSFISNLTKLVYDFLDVGKSPHPADCIFVLSGKAGRKDHGIQLWRVGYSPQLILSIGRQEWRDSNNQETKSDDKLELFGLQIPEEGQHFLIRLDQQETFCEQVSIGFLETFSEARVIAKYIRDLSIRSLLVVSSPIHTRRVSLAFRRVFRKSGIRLIFVAAPEKISFDTPLSRNEIWSEFLRYITYKFLILKIELKCLYG